MRKGKKRKETEQVIGKQDRMGRLFVAPPVILFLMFTLIPMIMAIGMSFTKYDVINPPSFVGLANFKKLIHDEFFWIALKNTCVYTILYVPLGLLILSAGAFFHGCDGNPVVLDSESAAWSSEWHLKNLRHSESGMALQFQTGDDLHCYDEPLGRLWRKHDDLPRRTQGNFPGLL